MILEKNQRETEWDQAFLQGETRCGDVPEGGIGILDAYHQIVDRLCDDYEARHVASAQANRARDRKRSALDPVWYERPSFPTDADFSYDDDYKPLAAEAEHHYGRLCEARLIAENCLLEALGTRKLLALHRVPSSSPQSAKVDHRVWNRERTLQRYPGFLDNRLPADMFAVPEQQLASTSLFLNEDAFGRWLNEITPAVTSVEPVPEADPRRPVGRPSHRAWVVEVVKARHQAGEGLPTDRAEANVISKLLKRERPNDPNRPLEETVRGHVRDARRELKEERSRGGNPGENK